MIDALGMCLVDERLEVHIPALIAVVHLREIHGVIAVIVVARSVLHHGGNPNGREAEGLDVVEFVDDAFEISTPAGIAGLDLFLLIVPTQHIVTRIAVVETGGHHEVDGLIAEVGAPSGEIVGIAVGLD